MTSVTDAETFTDLMRRTSRVLPEVGTIPEVRLLIVELHRSHVNAVIQGIYRFVSRVFDSPDCPNVDLTDLSASQSQSKNHYIPREFKDEENVNVCIFDESYLIDPTDLIKNVPEEMIDKIHILQEADDGIFMASLYKFLEHKSLHSINFKLLVIICSPEVSKAAAKVVSIWKLPCRVLMVTSSFDKKFLEQGMILAGIEKDGQDIKLTKVEKSEAINF